MSNNIGIKLIKFACWFLLGIVISLSCGAMLESSHGNLSQFYNMGYEKNVYFAGNGFEEVGYTYYYTSTKEFIINTPVARCSAQLDNLDSKYNFLFFKINRLDVEQIKCDISFVDEERNLVGSISKNLVNGENYINLPDGLNGYLVLAWEELEGTSFLLNEIKLKENNLIFDKNNYMFKVIILFLMYIVISVLFILFRKRIRIQDDRIIAKFMLMGERVLEKVPRAKINVSYCSIIRGGLFLILLVLWYFANLNGIRKVYLPMVGVTLVILGLMVYFLPFVGRKGKIYCGFLHKMWFYLCIVQCISDFIIRKEFPYTGYWMLFGFGLFFLAWGKMEKPEQLLLEFARAVEITYLATFLFCVFGEPFINGERFGGTWKNPNPFSIYLLLCEVVFLFEILYNLLTETKKSKCFAIIMAFLGYISGIWFIVQTKTRTAMVSLVVVTFLWLCFWLKKIWDKGGLRKYAVLFLLVILLGIGLIMGIQVVTGINRNINTLTLNDISSGRINIWKEYILHMNLFGHEKPLLIDGHRAYAHNGILRMMYEYGIIAGIFYLGLILSAVYFAGKYYFRAKKNAFGFLIMAIVISFVITGSLESVEEIPMVWPIWFAFYYIIGFTMIRSGSASKGDVVQDNINKRYFPNHRSLGGSYESGVIKTLEK